MNSKQRKGLFHRGELSLAKYKKLNKSQKKRAKLKRANQIAEFIYQEFRKHEGR